MGSTPAIRTFWLHSSLCAGIELNTVDLPRNNQRLSTTTTGCILIGSVGCLHESVFPLLAYLVALPAWLFGEHVCYDVGQVVA